MRGDALLLPATAWRIRKEHLELQGHALLNAPLFAMWVEKAELLNSSQPFDILPF
ncbi:dUTP diphosphatase [bacterium]|nr:dUTP diphosphatase [bacterium]